MELGAQLLGVDRRGRRYRHRPGRPAPEITLIGTPLFASKNGSVNGLVLKSMEPPASAALLPPGLAKKIVSTSNPASQSNHFPSRRTKGPCRVRPDVRL